MTKGRLRRDQSVAGTRSVVFSATDAAGNTSAAACAYQVTYAVRWLIPTAGVSTPMSVARNEVVPITFRLVDANGAAVNSAVVSALTSTVTACPSGPTPLVASVQGNACTTNLGDGRWLAGWKARAPSRGTCQRVSIGLSDGTAVTTVVTWSDPAITRDEHATAPSQSRRT